MKRDSDAAGEFQDDANDIEITIRVSKEDAVRLKKALAEGKLESLGITEMNFRGVLEPDATTTKWRQAELRNSENKGTLPLP